MSQIAVLYELNQYNISMIGAKLVKLNKLYKSN